ncbi:MAG: LysR family transcriptional regulator [Xanthobacteraceae bacterium]
MPWDDRLGRRLRLKDLQTLMTVIDAGGIGKAADRLNYSQPAVSKAIASLEQTLGQRLLERGRKGIELTPYGDALLKCGVAVFDDLRKGVADIDFLSDPAAGEVRIGCTEPVSAGIVSAVINRLARRYPRIAFQVLLRDPGVLHRELVARNVDLLIGQMERHIDEPPMQSEILYHEAVAVVAAARHPAASKRHVKLANLVDEPWALPPAQSFISARLAAAFRAIGLEMPRTTVAANSAYLRIMLVASGHFLSVVPAVMLKVGVSQLSIKALPVTLPANRRPIRLVTLQGRALSPVARLFIEHARTTARMMVRD